MPSLSAIAFNQSLMWHELEMINPIRDDKNYGSFRINQRTGVWSDFADGESGSDPISLVAYLNGYKQIDAAKDLADIFGVPTHG
jgi:putative DNA primase/helicase